MVIDEAAADVRIADVARHGEDLAARHRRWT
jgi:hypothetical protein